MKKIEVVVDSPVVIKIDGQEIKLSREEAKELMDKLAVQLQENIVYIPHYIPYPSINPNPWYPPYITYGNTWTATSDCTSGTISLY